jgi:flagellar basal-body rod modification protein FlgD
MAMKTVGNDGTSPLDSLKVSSKSSTNSTGSSQDLGQDQFLQLMIAQLKNQNPLKPMEDGQFLGQMAQFATVSGIQGLQSTVDQLSSALQSNQALQASALVGHSVLSNGGKAILDSGGSIDGVVDLPGSTTQLKLKVTDNAGQLVRTLDLGPQASGSVHFSWDGIAESGKPAVPGTYNVTAEAIIDGDVTAVDVQTAAKVESVSLGQNGQEIVVNLTGLGSVPLSDVKQIM